MSAAGREMGLSPAVVSKRVSQLEERLGRPPVPAHDAPTHAHRDGCRLFQARRRHPEPVRGSRGFRQPPQHQAARAAEDHIADDFSRLHIAPYSASSSPRYPDIELDVHLTDTLRRHHPRGVRPRHPHRGAGGFFRSSRANRRPTIASSARLRRIWRSTARQRRSADLEESQLPLRRRAGRVAARRSRGQRQIRTQGNVRSNSARAHP